jgi:hypothetical protein
VCIEKSMFSGKVINSDEGAISVECVRGLLSKIDKAAFVSYQII